MTFADLVAVMQRHGLTRLASRDVDFDRVPAFRPPGVPGVRCRSCEEARSLQSSGFVFMIHPSR